MRLHEVCATPRHCPESGWPELNIFFHAEPCIFSLNSDNTVREELLLSPVCRRGNWVLGKLSGLPTFKQLEKDGAELDPQPA